MFTGIIQAIGVVKAVRPQVLCIDLGNLAKKLAKGESIAVNGVCLTVTKLAGTVVEFDLSAETLAKTTLGELRLGDVVNIELALKADARLGGHIVQGHIDGIARIKKIQKTCDFADMTFSAPAELLKSMVTKGSAAIDGVSLTIADMDETTFTVALIPTTLQQTTLGAAKIGNQVNIETDIITKTIGKMLEKILPQKQGLSVEKLKQSGF